MKVSESSICKIHRAVIARLRKMEAQVYAKVSDVAGEKIDGAIIDRALRKLRKMKSIKDRGLLQSHIPAKDAAELKALLAGRNMRDFKKAITTGPASASDLYGELHAYDEQLLLMSLDEKDREFLASAAKELDLRPTDSQKVSLAITRYAKSSDPGASPPSMLADFKSMPPGQKKEVAEILSLGGWDKEDMARILGLPY